MAAAIGLEEHARPGHPLASAAVARRPAGPRQGLAGLGQDPANGPRAHREIGQALLGQGLGEMDRVEPGELGRGQLDQARPDVWVGPVGGRPVAVAVDERGGPLGAIAVDQAADLTDRELQDPARLIGRQLPGEHMVEDIQALLGSAVQADRLPRLLHEIEGDKVAVPLAWTESLSSDIRYPPRLTRPCRGP